MIKEIPEVLRRSTVKTVVAAACRVNLLIHYFKISFSLVIDIISGVFDLETSQNRKPVRKRSNFCG